jgi:alcohol dehydrogenase YqhD (iron-dependent ADH family)
VAPALISCYTFEMVQFRLDLPAAVLFGPGTLAELPAIARRHGNRLFLLTGASWLERAGRLSSVRAALGDAAIEHFERAHHRQR